MLYIDEDLPAHPKILKAGAQLGENGPALALFLYVAGLSYARHHLTDGFVPDAFVSTCGYISTPDDVAKALSARGVRLWERVRGGYRIHDFFEWNPNASTVKEKRAKEAARKRAQRHGDNGHFQSGVRVGHQPGHRQEPHRDSCARGTTIQYPDLSSTSQPRSRDPRGLYPLSTNRRWRAGFFAKKENSHAEDSDVRDPLRDGARGDHGRTAARRRGVVRADQTAAGPSAVRLPVAARADGGDTRLRARADESLGAADAAVATRAGGSPAARPAAAGTPPAPGVDGLRPARGAGGRALVALRPPRAA